MRIVKETKLRESMMKKGRKEKRRTFEPFVVQSLIVMFLLASINVVFASADSGASLTKIKPSPDFEKRTMIQDEMTLPKPKAEVVIVKEETETKEISVTTEVQTPETSSPYSPSIPLPREHQEFLYTRSVELGIDYEKALAVMEHESKFDPNAIGATSDYGYFQINQINHKWMTDVNNTTNSPLDPKTNIIWGTYMLNWLNEHWKSKGLSGDALDVAVWSSYNKGIGGYQQTGEATEYISKVRESLELVKKWRKEDGQ